MPATQGKASSHESESKLQSPLSSESNSNLMLENLELHLDDSSDDEETTYNHAPIIILEASEDTNSEDTNNGVNLISPSRMHVRSRFSSTAGEKKTIDQFFMKFKEDGGLNAFQERYQYLTGEGDAKETVQLDDNVVKFFFNLQSLGIALLHHPKVTKDYRNLKKKYLFQSANQEAPKNLLAFMTTCRERAASFLDLNIEVTEGEDFGDKAQQSCRDRNIEVKKGQYFGDKAQQSWQEIKVTSESVASKIAENQTISKSEAKDTRAFLSEIRSPLDNMFLRLLYYRYQQEQKLTNQAGNNIKKYKQFIDDDQLLRKQKIQAFCGELLIERKKPELKKCILEKKEVGFNNEEEKQAKAPKSRWADFKSNFGRKEIKQNKKKNEDEIALIKYIAPDKNPETYSILYTHNEPNANNLNESQIVLVYKEPSYEGSLIYLNHLFQKKSVITEKVKENKIKFNKRGESRLNDPKKINELLSVTQETQKLRIIKYQPAFMNFLWNKTKSVIERSEKNKEFLIKRLSTLLARRFISELRIERFPRFQEELFLEEDVKSSTDLLACTRLLKRAIVRFQVNKSRFNSVNLQEIYGVTGRETLHAFPIVFPIKNQNEGQDKKHGAVVSTKLTPQSFYYFDEHRLLGCQPKVLNFGAYNRINLKETDDVGEWRKALHGVGNSSSTEPDQTAFMFTLLYIEGLRLPAVLIANNMLVDLISKKYEGYTSMTYTFEPMPDSKNEYKSGVLYWELKNEAVHYKVLKDSDIKTGALSKNDLFVKDIPKTKKKLLAIRDKVLEATLMRGHTLPENVFSDCMPLAPEGSEKRARSITKFFARYMPFHHGYYGNKVDRRQDQRQVQRLDKRNLIDIISKIEKITRAWLTMKTGNQDLNLNTIVKEGIYSWYPELESENQVFFSTLIDIDSKGTDSESSAPRRLVF